MIKYIKGNLFSNQDAFLLHACNCFGNWGNGVAAVFKSEFPEAYLKHSYLKNNPAQPGSIQILYDEDRQRTIICLFTSRCYGRFVDTPEKILENTRMSLAVLGIQFKDKNVKIASPKINAGLFNVPWEKTETLINEFLEKNPNVEWKVYYLDDVI